MGFGKQVLTIGCGVALGISILAAVPAILSLGVMGVGVVGAVVAESGKWKIEAANRERMIDEKKERFADLQALRLVVQDADIEGRRIRVAGEIVNETDKTVGKVPVVVVFRGEDGQVLATVPAVSVDSVEAHGKRSFVGEAEKPEGSSKWECRIADE